MCDVTGDRFILIAALMCQLALYMILDGLRGVLMLCRCPNAGAGSD